MAKVTKLCIGESLVGEGNEVAHIDLLIGPRGSAAESAFAHALTNNKEGFTSLLAVVGPNLVCKPPTVLFNKVTIKGAKQAVQMFGPAQHAVAMAVADSVAEGVIPANEADDLFICVGVFIHWDATDDRKIQDFNYRATKEAIARAVNDQPQAAEVVANQFDRLVAAGVIRADMHRGAAWCSRHGGKIRPWAEFESRGSRAIFINRSAVSSPNGRSFLIIAKNSPCASSLRASIRRRPVSMMASIDFCQAAAIKPA